MRADEQIESLEGAVVEVQCFGNANEEICEWRELICHNRSHGDMGKLSGRLRSTSLWFVDAGVA
jgi:hypothetical protein